MVLMHVRWRQPRLELWQRTKGGYFPTFAILHKNRRISRKRWRQLLALFISKTAHETVTVYDGNIAADEPDFWSARVGVSATLGIAAQPFAMGRFDSGSSFEDVTTSGNPIGIFGHNGRSSHRITLCPSDSVRIEDLLNCYTVGGLVSPGRHQHESHRSNKNCCGKQS